MSAARSDRNLLFGILAVQMNFVGRDALIEGLNAWVLQKHRRDVLKHDAFLWKIGHITHGRPKLFNFGRTHRRER